MTYSGSVVSDLLYVRGSVDGLFVVCTTLGDDLESRDNQGEGLRINDVPMEGVDLYIS